MTFSSKAASCAGQPKAAGEPVEVYRRYPAPEMVQLTVKAATTTSAGGPAMPPSSTSSVCNDTEVSTATHEATTCIALRLRWGVQAKDLRRVYEMHEDAYPISYTASYYEWLLNHDACIGLVALVTEETYKEGTNRWREMNDSTLDAWAAQAAPVASSLSTSLPDSIPPAGPPPASQCRPTAEALQERAQILSIIAEQERIAAREETDSHPEGTTGVSSDAGSHAAAHTVIVGFIIGQIAYARHDAGHLLSNPTAYIGSFAVDTPFQTCGVGHALLQRFITYVTQQRPIYAQDYLHYDERKLIALLADAQIKKRKAGVNELLNSAFASAAAGASDDGGDGTRQVAENPSGAPLSPPPISSATPSPLSRPAPPPPSVFQSLVYALLPELQGWMEDRQARLRLRRCGLAEEDIDAQRFRDRLASDALTDEEAEEVRRGARRFVVETGVRDVWLHCLPGNLKAIRFYAHRGFRLHRVLTGYYDISGVPYDAHLLHYARSSDGPAAVSVASAEHSSAGVTGRLTDIGRGGERCAAPRGEEVTGLDGAAFVTAAAPVSSLPSLPPPSTGLRRRRGVPPLGEEGGVAAAELAVAEGGRVATPAATTSTFTGAAGALAEKATRVAQTSPQTASWLSPRTYPVVADIILCTAAKGQEEWRRRTGSKGPGDVKGQRPGWWETVREVIFAANALGLLCVVLWLTYNIALTGTVE
ncbi:hypothetical protein LSCM1_06773 [Leishmania martiniquensis]|uniref:N-alpha-acetyltransferase 60 n=1 Tax=Leishmania martiniquensis TaxID=1580590 RepID=A0A836HR44_9TRYP|nr:hypothetical protein LSCM1_06773 [Leishmania martiniquensis]